MIATEIASVVLFGLFKVKGFRSKVRLKVRLKD